MKRSFFKKISFVMAVVMMMSIAAPAEAFAATALKLNAASKVLFLGEEDKFDFNVQNGVKGQTCKWTSSDTKVAAVDAKTGLATAKAVGKTTVKVVVSNAKGVVKTLSATVNVGDNMKTVSIVAPEGVDLEALEVAKEYDFNRSFVTMGGSETRTSNITVWSLDKEGAAISASGVFKAEKTGEYTITARAFRSKAQYKAWVAEGSEEDSGYIKAADSLKVLVLNSIKEVKQVSTAKFEVVFASKVSTLSKTTAKVVQIVAGKEVTSGAEKIKSITMDSTGTVATVELHGDFVDKGTYKFIYGAMEGSFEVASKDRKLVTGLAFDDFNVDTSSGSRSTNLLDHIYAVNSDGIRILKGSEISTYLDFEAAGDLTKGYVDNANKTAYIYNAGDTVTVKATFTDHLYNETTKKYDTVKFSDTATGTGVPAEVDPGTLQYAVVLANKARPFPTATAWTAEKAIALGDGRYDIYTRYKKTTDSSAAGYTYTNSGSTMFQYVSSDPGKLSVIGTTLYPLAAGTATVLVKSMDGTKVLGSFDVKINIERVLAFATADTPSVSVGNNSFYGETKEIVITALDNTGTGMDVSKINPLTPELLSKPSNATATLPVLTHSVNALVPGKVNVKATAKNCVAGSYRYKMKIENLTSTGTITKEAVFDVNVAESNSSINNADVTVRYVLVFKDLANSVEGTGYDYNYIAGAKNIDISVYGVNNSGYRVSKLNHLSDYTTEIKLPGAATATGSSLTIATFTPISFTEGVTKLKPAGTYMVTAKSVSTGALSMMTDGTVFTSASFTLTNYYAKTWNMKAYALKQSAHPTVRDVLKEALDMTVAGFFSYAEIDFGTVNQRDIDIKGINNQSGGSASIALSDLVSSGTDLYLDTITVRVTEPFFFNNVWWQWQKEFTFDIKQSIAIK